MVALEVIVGMRLIEIEGDTTRNFKTINTIWQKGQDGIARHAMDSSHYFSSCKFVNYSHKNNEFGRRGDRLVKQQW